MSLLSSAAMASSSAGGALSPATRGAVGSNYSSLVAWAPALNSRCSRASFIAFCTVARPSPKLSFAASSALPVHATLAAEAPETVKSDTGTWTWKNRGSSLGVFFEEHAGASSRGSSCQNILLLPTISDVSSTEEWRAVALKLLSRAGSPPPRILIPDWPGFGLSDRPRVDYTADFLESFLVDFVTAPDSPLNGSESPPVIIGGGHAATMAVRAVKKGLIKARALATVAPTWAGPMPIVFGRGSDMETRYGLLRGSLQAPGVGWMMYNFLVSNPKNIRLQYLSHVYADPDNVTPGLVESRLALTKREGARYAPAAFLTGLLDPVQTREEFLALFEELEGNVPVLVLVASKAPKRSKAEMVALRGAKGVSQYAEVPGALLPQEEYPDIVADELYAFLSSLR